MITSGIRGRSPVPRRGCPIRARRSRLPWPYVRWRRPDAGDRASAVVGDVGAEDLAWPGSVAAARRVTPSLTTSLTGSWEALRVYVLVVRGVVGQKFVVHHLRSPRPVKPGGQGTAPNPVLADQFCGRPAGLLCGQQPRCGIERRPVAQAQHAARRYLHRVGAPQTPHRARPSPDPEVGSAAVDHPVYACGYGTAVSPERGDLQVLGRREMSEVAGVGGFLRIIGLG